MKMVALIGSLREASLNRMVFEHYRRSIGDQYQMAEGRFDDFPPYNEDVRESGVPDSVQRLADEVSRADAVFIFSPEYNYSIPGPLKNALDWLSKLSPPPLSGKPVAVISASPGKFGGARMQYQLRQVGVALNLRLMNGPEIMIAEAHKKFSADRKLMDIETEKHLKRHWDAFLAFMEICRSSRSEG